MKKALKITLSIAMIATIAITAILPCFAISGGSSGLSTHLESYIAGSGVETITIEGAESKYEMPYQTAIVGDNPSFFGQPQPATAIAWSNTIIINSKIVFKNDIDMGELDNFEWFIPMFKFYPSTAISGQPSSKRYDKIHVKKWSSTYTQKMELYYVSGAEEYLVMEQTRQYIGGVWDVSSSWLNEGYKTIYPDKGTGETPWTAEDDGITWYTWLKNSATFTTYAGSGSATDKNSSPFRRTLISTTYAERINNEHVKATTTYECKAWWQANGEPLTIRFKGQNVVIDSYANHDYAMIDELPDVSANLNIVYVVRYTYFYNNSTTDEEDSWEVYTGSQVIEWHRNASDIPLYPKMEDLFNDSVVPRIGGIIYDEFETVITLGSPVINNFNLVVHDHYYRGNERREHEVAGFFDAFRRNFNSKYNVEWGDIGDFLSSSVGGFFDTNLFGTFSIGDALMTIIAIGMVVVFLKIFAGG